MDATDVSSPLTTIHGAAATHLNMSTARSRGRGRGNDLSLPSFSSP